MSTNNNTIVCTNSAIVSNPIMTGNSRNSYPEIRAYSIDGKINTQSVKMYLYNNGFLDGRHLVDPKCDISVIAYGIYKAFKSGKLSLNCTKQTGVINETPIRMSTSLGGKMLDVWAFSTLSLVNPLCQIRMRNNKLVCAHCYVKNSLYICAVLNYVQNSYILMNYELPTEWIPVIREKCARKHPIIRIESFGDLFCILQAENYLRIVHANPAFRFGMWTKNPNYLAQAIDNMGKPENLSTVWSMSVVNKMDFSDKFDSYFDHKFIVVEDSNLKDKYLMNPGFYPCKCGKHSCMNCQKCYTRKGFSKPTTAVELLRK